MAHALTFDGRDDDREVRERAVQIAFVLYKESSSRGGPVGQMAKLTDLYHTPRMSTYE